jgi:hypothetical protein
MRSILSLAVVVLSGSCGKNVPLADNDATVTDTRCAALTTPVFDGEPCPAADDGLACNVPASCGHDTITCSGGYWQTIRCGNGCPGNVGPGQQCPQENSGATCTVQASCGAETLTCGDGQWNLTTACDSGRHCPCLGPADCDPGSQCKSDGICHPTTTPSCGTLGESCCGGSCGTCGDGLVCSGALCGPSPGSGTLGLQCTTQCDGTFNCDPGQYCPDSCLTCPCTDTCHAQLSICTVGQDQTCNDDPAISALYGHCVASQGPFSTTCSCSTGHAVSAQTGKCI